MSVSNSAYLYFIKRSTEYQCSSVFKVQLVRKCQYHYLEYISTILIAIQFPQASLTEHFSCWWSGDEHNPLNDKPLWGIIVKFQWQPGDVSYDFIFPIFPVRTIWFQVL